MICKRKAFTLIELLAAMTTASILLLGMVSTIYVSLQGVDETASPAGQAIGEVNALADLEYDLLYATSVTNTSASALQITVGDRNNDATSETITYSWSGTDGEPLNRSLNSGAAEVVIDNIQDLEFTYIEDSDAKLLFVGLDITAGSGKPITTAFATRNRP